jgi:GR25 family glycosyltransferase involved in LPS biosynthesis
MKPGAIGCYLSHLCVLQDAYDSGYKTIWVLEDDIVVEKDPHLLSSYIEKLDVLVGEYGWDILYTDMDFDADTYLQSAREFPHFFWRPDIDTSSNYQRFIERNPVGEDFLSIGSRSRAHSMIIRRSGMKKILDYAKEYHMFLPYDHDVAIVPGIKLFNLRNNIVTVSETVSDTNSGEFTKKTKWDEYRKNVIEESKSIPRWNSLDSSDKVMQLLYDIQPNTCVEIGCFGGATTYQIAKTLSFLKKGKLYAIDAWDVAAAVKKIKDNSLIETFKSLNWQSVQKGCETLIASKNLNTYCTLIQELSEQAASRFSDESIDFLYIDGNPSSEGSLTDVLTYLPKVKKGGYICLNGANTLEKTASIAHLLKYCFWLKEEFKDPRCLLFQKKQ